MQRPGRENTGILAAPSRDPPGPGAAKSAQGPAQGKATLIPGAGREGWAWLSQRPSGEAGPAAPALTQGRGQEPPTGDPRMLFGPK